MSGGQHLREPSFDPIFGACTHCGEAGPGIGFGWSDETTRATHDCDGAREKRKEDAFARRTLDLVARVEAKVRAEMQAKVDVAERRAAEAEGEAEHRTTMLQVVLDLPSTAGWETIIERVASARTAEVALASVATGGQGGEGA